MFFFCLFKTIEKNNNCHKNIVKEKSLAETQVSHEKYRASQRTEIFPEVVGKTLEVIQKAYWFYPEHHTSSCGE